MFLSEIPTPPAPQGTRPLATLDHLECPNLRLEVLPVVRAAVRLILVVLALVSLRAYFAVDPVTEMLWGSVLLLVSGTVSGILLLPRFWRPWITLVADRRGVILPRRGRPGFYLVPWSAVRAVRVEHRGAGRDRLILGLRLDSDDLAALYGGNAAFWPGHPDAGPVPVPVWCAGEDADAVLRRLQAIHPLPQGDELPA